MKKNVGKKDKNIRFILGIIFLVLAVGFLSGALQIISAVLAIIMFFTALTEFCLVYPLLKINTKEKSTEEER